MGGGGEKEKRDCLSLVALFIKNNIKYDLNNSK